MKKLSLLILLGFLASVVLIAGCVQPEYCGNNVCEAGETYTTCPQDCNQPPVQSHSECQNQQCVQVEGAGENKCVVDADCAPPVQPSVCGDGKCAFDENSTICPIDCGPVDGIFGSLGWPIGCTPGLTCAGMGYPDIDGDGKAFNCILPAAYLSHSGTDIGISQQQQDEGTPVYATLDGTVKWVYDGRYDKCTSARDSSQPADCQGADASLLVPGGASGVMTCTENGDYCMNGQPDCTTTFLCLGWGNAIMLLHDKSTGIFATTYWHLKKGSILVKPGDHVIKGQKIAEAGSSGNSSGPHLHFEVWKNGYLDTFDPWGPGACGSPNAKYLWQNSPPWTK